MVRERRVESPKCIRQGKHTLRKGIFGKGTNQGGVVSPESRTEGETIDGVVVQWVLWGHEPGGGKSDLTRFSGCRSEISNFLSRTSRRLRLV